MEENFAVCFFLLAVYCTGINITMDDLLNYRVRSYPAVSMPLRSGHVIYTTGPPTSGVVTAFMLRVLEGM